MEPEEKYNLNQKRNVYKIVFNKVYDCDLEAGGEDAHKWAWFARTHDWVMDGYYCNIMVWDYFIGIAKKHFKKNPWDIWPEPKDPPNEPSDDEDIKNKIKKDD